MRESGAWVTTSDDEGNHPVSSPESFPISGDIPTPTTTVNAMDWESWPTARPGPVVSEAEMQEAMDTFHSYDLERGEWSRTEEKVFHVAEFSSSGQGKSDVYRT